VPAEVEDCIEASGDCFDACFAFHLTVKAACSTVFLSSVPIIKLPRGLANSKANIPQPVSRFELAVRFKKDFTKVVLNSECTADMLAANSVTHEWKN